MTRPDFIRAKISVAEVQALMSRVGELETQVAQWSSAASEGDGNPLLTPDDLITTLRRFMEDRDTANTRLTRQSAVIEAMDAVLEDVLLPWKDASDDELRSLSECPGVLRGEAVLVIKARTARAARAAMEGEADG